MPREMIRKDIPFVLPEDAMMKRLHCDDVESEVFQRCLELLEMPENQPEPAFILREFPVEDIGETDFQVGGVRFHSKIAGHLLENVPSVFIYIATSGRKINEQIEKTDDALDAYILDQIAYLAYRQASDELSEAIEKEYGIERHIRLCPGSIIDWSVIDVKKYFPLLDGLYQQLDLRVLDSGLIDPLKSTSGMLYESDTEFESCSICPRAKCPNRTVPFDEEKHETMMNL